MFGLGWDALAVEKSLRSGGPVVVDQGLIDRWRKEGAPVLLDFGAGPRVGEAVVQLPGVRRLRVERQAGPGVVVSGDYASWETRGSLRGGSGSLDWWGKSPRTLGPVKS